MYYSPEDKVLFEQTEKRYRDYAIAQRKQMIKDMVEYVVVAAFVVFLVAVIALLFLPSVDWCVENYQLGQVAECMIRENHIFGHLVR